MWVIELLFDSRFCRSGCPAARAGTECSNQIPLRINILTTVRPVKINEMSPTDSGLLTKPQTESGWPDDRVPNLLGIRLDTKLRSCLSAPHRLVGSIRPLRQ